MSKLQFTPTVEIDLDDMLQGIAHLETKDLERFADKVIDLRAQSRAPSLSENEFELLQRINHNVPQRTRTRFAELKSKLHAETITEVERSEFIAISDQIELADAERVTTLIELAQLRKVSVDTLMKQLGIKQRNHA